MTTIRPRLALLAASRAHEARAVDARRAWPVIDVITRSFDFASDLSGLARTLAKLPAPTTPRVVDASRMQDAVDAVKSARTRGGFG